VGARATSSRTRELRRSNFAIPRLTPVSNGNLPDGRQNIPSFDFTSMGIDDRHYMRHDWPGRHRRPSWLWLMVVAILVIGAGLLVITSRAGRSKPAVRKDPRSMPAPPARVSLVDVNTASFDELDDLPYISPKVAGAIIEGRPYAKPEDLLRVRGIGPKVLERIRPHISVEASQPNAKVR
jgi:competence protein ComEA